MPLNPGWLTGPEPAFKLVRPHPLFVRQLVYDDVYRGLLDCLEALAPVNISPVEAILVCRKRWEAGVRTFVAVAIPEGRVAEAVDGLVKVGPHEQAIVGTASLLVEPKFLHGGRPAAHVEDVAVLPAWRKKGVGRILMHHLLREARRAGCYKAILDCRGDVVPFYQHAGFRMVNTVHMRIDLTAGA